MYKLKCTPRLCIIIIVAYMILPYLQYAIHRQTPIDDSAIPLDHTVDSNQLMPPWYIPPLSSILLMHLYGMRHSEGSHVNDTLRDKANNTLTSTGGVKLAIQRKNYITNQRRYTDERVIHLKSGILHTKHQPVLSNNTRSIDVLSFLVHMKQALFAELQRCIPPANATETHHPPNHYVISNYIPHNTYLIVNARPSSTPVSIQHYPRDLYSDGDSVIQCIHRLPHVIQVLPYISIYKYDQHSIKELNEFFNSHNNTSGQSDSEGIQHLTKKKTTKHTVNDTLKLRVVLFYDIGTTVREPYINQLIDKLHSTYHIPLQQMKSTSHILMITLQKTQQHVNMNHTHHTEPFNVSLLLESIALSPIVEYIEIQPAFHTLTSHASGTIQSGDVSNRLMHQHNITGHNQIVAVGDTGVAYKHCMFYDQHEGVAYNTTNYRHRKIISYIPHYNFTYDHPRGHGTFIAASIAGKIDISPSIEHDIHPMSNSTLNEAELANHQHVLQSLSSYNGIAPHAKLVVFSFNDGTSETRIRPGNDIYHRYYQRSYDMAARICSNSWGAIRSHYIRESEESDRFIYQHPDFLLIFAAGNDGMEVHSFNDAVAPSTAKNVLSVGAVRNYPVPLYIDDGLNHLCIDNPKHITFDMINTARDIGADRGDGVEKNNDNEINQILSRELSPITSKRFTSDMRIKPEIVVPGDRIIAAQSNGDINLPSCVNCNDNLMSEGGTSMSAALVAGAAALLREYYINGFYPSGKAIKKDSMNPSNALIRATLIHSAMNDIITIDESYDALYTSKAHSARDTLYTKYQPSPLYGYGRVNLGNVVRFHDTMDSTPSVYINDNVEIHNREYISYCYRVVNESYNFRSTLVWSDPPAALSSSFLLINNLDLYVYHFDFKNNESNIFLGNHWLEENNDTDEEQVPQSDKSNVIEQATIDRELLNVGDMILVHVKAASIPHTASQQYAIINSAAMEQLPIEECESYASCPDDCSGPSNGKCLSDGTCECDTDHYGVDCSLMVEELEVGCDQTENSRIGVVAANRTLGVGDYHYFTVHANKTPRCSEIHSSNTQPKQYRPVLHLVMHALEGEVQMYVNAGSNSSLPSIYSHANTTHDFHTNIHTLDIPLMPHDDSSDNVYKAGVFTHCCSDGMYNISASIVLAPQSGKQLASADDISNVIRIDNTDASTISMNSARSTSLQPFHVSSFRSINDMDRLMRDRSDDDGNLHISSSTYKSSDGHIVAQRVHSNP